MESKKTELLYKVLVVGDVGTGKTSIIKQYVHGLFTNHYKSTIGVDFALKVLDWDPNTIVRIQLWDIAGQERYGNMTRVYYKEAVAAFIVFDVTRLSTLESAKKWKEDIDSKVKIPGTENSIPVVLLANKIDLIENGEWGFTKQEMDMYCKKNGFVGWFETSAKELTGVTESVNKLVEEIIKSNINISKDDDKNEDNNTIDINDPKEKKNDCSCFT